MERLRTENMRVRAALANQGRATRKVARQLGLAKVRSCCKVKPCRFCTHDLKPSLTCCQVSTEEACQEV